MDKPFWAVLGLAIVAVIIVLIVIFTRRRGGAQRTEAKLRGPFGLSMQSASSSEITPGVVGKNLSSTDGGLSAADNTGRGVSIDGAATKKDIKLTNNPTNSTEGADPKS